MNTSTTPTTPSSSPTFADLGLNSGLVKHLATLQFNTPTPIQIKTIPTLLNSEKDFVGLAPTGTGKTAAFGLPLVEKINPNNKKTQALVLSPTRELAQQVAQQLQNFGRHKNIQVVTIYGGGSYSTQLSGIRRGAHIVVATPGRLVDFLDKGAIDLGSVEFVVLDEADEMVSRGFKEDLELILEATQSQENAPRTWLFSATMSASVQKIANSYLKVAERSEIKNETRLSESLQQFYCAVAERDKREVLLRILQSEQNFYGLIFCEMKSQAADLSRFLMEKGYPSEAIHGDRSQSERERTLARFRSRSIKALVGTDVAARGLDIKELTHVINYTMPWSTDTYVHRIGRTARNGESGIAINLVSSHEIQDLHRVQGKLKTVIKKMEIPSGDNLTSKKIEAFQEKMTVAMANHFLFPKALKIVEEAKLSAEFKNKSVTEILAGWLIANHSDMIFQKDITTLNVDTRSRQDNWDNVRESRHSRGGGRGGPRRGGGGRGGPRGGPRSGGGRSSGGGKSSGGSSKSRSRR